MSATEVEAKLTKPNILFIMADDLGWRDLGCYGSVYHQTPNLDKLAGRGVRFTQAYAANPLCSPTRSSILTGLWPARTGIAAPACHLPKVVLEKQLVKGNPNQPVLVAESLTRLKTEYVTLPEVLRDAGYRTGHFGKWHLGPEPYSAPPTSNLPLRNGKASLYEGGVREPCIVVWPTVTRAGSVNDTIIQSIDWMPTILDMAGVPIPESVRPDGISIVPALKGDSLNRDAIFTHFPHDTPASGQHPATSVRRGDWKLLRFFAQNEDGSDQLELYNLREDLGETQEVSKAHPEITKELNALITRFLDETGAVVPKRNPSFRVREKAS